MNANDIQFQSDQVRVKRKKQHEQFVWLPSLYIIMFSYRFIDLNRTLPIRSY